MRTRTLTLKWSREIEDKIAEMREISHKNTAGVVASALAFLAF